MSGQSINVPNVSKTVFFSDLWTVGDVINARIHEICVILDNQRFSQSLFPLQTPRLPQTRFYQIYNRFIHTIPFALCESKGIKNNCVKGAAVI